MSLLALAACTTSREAAETGGPSVVTSTSVTATTTTLPSSSTTKSDVPSTTSTTIPIGDLSLGLVPVADGFTAPVLVTHRPEEEWLFVVDQPGRIWLIDGSAVSIFLDINERVTFRGEQGLLGVAFHPEQPELFYVNYIDGNGDTVVAEFHNSADRTVADPGSERVVLTVDQPASNHNGGMMAFGPDGNLWIGMGDGGAANDSFGNGQRGDTLLGSMLRIVVGSDVTPYGIPAGNVFEHHDRLVSILKQVKKANDARMIERSAKLVLGGQARDLEGGGLGRSGCLVRPFVLGETHVAIYAEHRATDRARIGDEPFADLLEMGTEVADEV